MPRHGLIGGCLLLSMLGNAQSFAESMLPSGEVAKIPAGQDIRTKDPL